MIRKLKSKLQLSKKSPTVVAAYGLLRKELREQYDGIAVIKYAKNVSCNVGGTSNELFTPYPRSVCVGVCHMFVGDDAKQLKNLRVLLCQRFMNVDILTNILICGNFLMIYHRCQLIIWQYNRIRSIIYIIGIGR